MTRSGTPKWTYLQIRSLCGGTLSYQKVAQALLKMFGGDHKPNVRDLPRTAQESAYQMDDDEDVFYEEPADLYYDDEVYNEYHEPYSGDFEEDSVYFEDEMVPEELDAANEEVEDAYLSYVDSRRKMKEIALARVFCPVMAVPPSCRAWSLWKLWRTQVTSQRTRQKQGQRKRRRKRKRKRRRQRRRRTPLHLLPPHCRSSKGWRIEPGDAKYGQLEVYGCWTSGSTAAHGPRFKRYRLQDAGSKPAEDISMVEDVDRESRLWLDRLWSHEDGDNLASLAEASCKGANVEAKKVFSDLRFGDGATLRSSVDVTFPVRVAGKDVELTASIIPDRRLSCLRGRCLKGGR